MGKSSFIPWPPVFHHPWLWGFNLSVFQHPYHVMSCDKDALMYDSSCWFSELVCGPWWQVLAAIFCVSGDCHSVQVLVKTTSTWKFVSAHRDTSDKSRHPAASANTGISGAQMRCWLYSISIWDKQKWHRCPQTLALARKKKCVHVCSCW